MGRLRGLMAAVVGLLAGVARLLKGLFDAVARCAGW
jgi:hypothetical protein